MLESIKVTLYDIFGYLIPGGVALTALAISYWALLHPDKSLQYIDLPGPLVTIILVVAYLAGHIVQSLCNGLESLARRLAGGTPLWLNREHIFTQNLNPDLVAAAKRKLHAMGLQIGDDPITLIRVCEELVKQRGTREDLDVYEYREGFYRGTSLAFVLLSLALFLRFCIGKTAVTFLGANTDITREAFFFLIPSSIFAAILLHCRYLRFLELNTRTPILGLLALKTDSDKK